MLSVMLFFWFFALFTFIDNINITIGSLYHLTCVDVSKHNTTTHCIIKHRVIGRTGRITAIVGWNPLKHQGNTCTELVECAVGYQGAQHGSIVSICAIGAIGAVGTVGGVGGVGTVEQRLDIDGLIDNVIIDDIGQIKVLNVRIRIVTAGAVQRICLRDTSSLRRRR